MEQATLWRCLANMWHPWYSLSDLWRLALLPLSPHKVTCVCWGRSLQAGSAWRARTVWLTCVDPAQNKLRTGEGGSCWFKDSFLSHRTGMNLQAVMSCGGKERGRVGWEEGTRWGWEGRRGLLILDVDQWCVRMVSECMHTVIVVLRWGDLSQPDGFATVNCRKLCQKRWLYCDMVTLQLHGKKTWKQFFFYRTWQEHAKSRAKLEVFTYKEISVEVGMSLGTL